MPLVVHAPPAGAMHRVGDELPAGHLLGAVDARRARIGDALRRDLGGFADDQSGAGALRVIGGVEFSRHIAGPGAVARHRRHHHAVRQVERAEAKGRENVHARHLKPTLVSPRFGARSREYVRTFATGLPPELKCYRGRQSRTAGSAPAVRPADIWSPRRSAAATDQNSPDRRAWW